MVELAALHLRPATFDPVGTLQTAVGMQRQQQEGELSRLRMEQMRAELAEADTRRSALGAFRGQGGLNNPAAVTALAGHPDLYTGAQTALNNQQQQTLLANARGAHRVLGFPEGSPERAQAWQEELQAALQNGRITPQLHQQYSQVPQPPALLLQSIISQARNLPTELESAHTDYYRAAGRALLQNSDVRQQNADTRRQALELDRFLERLGTAPTAQQWESENQPGGIIHTMFGGPQPFSNAPAIIHQVQARRSAGPAITDQEAAEVGLSAEEIQSARRQRALDNIWGRPPANHRRLADGSVELIPGLRSEGEGGLTDAERRARTALQRDFATGRSANHVRSLNTVLGHLDSLDQSIAKLDNWDYFSGANRLFNSEAYLQSHPERRAALRTFDTNRQAVASELMRVFREAGASVTEVQHWRDNFNAADSPIALRAAVRAAVELVGSRMSAVNDVWNRGMGVDRPVTEVLSPAARATYERLLTGLPVVRGPSEQTGRRPGPPPGQQPPPAPATADDPLGLR